MLRWRLLLGTLIVAVLVGLCWVDARSNGSGVWLLPVALIAAVLATGEMLALLAAAGLRPAPAVVYAANLLVTLSGWTPWLAARKSLPGGPGAALALEVAAVAVAVLAVFFAEMWRYRKPGHAIANLAGGILAIVYIGFMLRFAIWLRLSYGIGALAVWIIVVKMGDTGAYTVGRLFGRHKMAPAISPGKTIEGAAGAFLFACLSSWLAFQFLVPFAVTSTTTTGPVYGWLVFGLLVGGVGMLGDLAESLLKRDVGVKDSSTWMPGFGGVLDILDSLLLSAPVAWFCFEFGLAGR
ncbi:MAG: phosphatidate cytidylyltransferase [Thermoguttaceae bacterium]